MRAIYCIVIIFLFYGVRLSHVYAQGTTSKGTNFWTCYMDDVHYPVGNAPSTMILYITADKATTGNVTLADGSFSTSFSVAPNSITFVTIPGSAFLSQEGQYLKGIHITSIRAIAVVAHIYASGSSSATLLLPVNALGKTYCSTNYAQPAVMSGYSSFAVIATEDSTNVTIKPVADLTSGHSARMPFTVTLQKGEVYQGLAEKDLSGTLIQSVSTATSTCKKIAVFSGSSNTGIGCSPGGNYSTQNFIQQDHPTSSWGKSYIIVPLINRPYTIVRIFAVGTTINVSSLDQNGYGGTTVARNNLASFQSLQSTVSSVTYVKSDDPIQVVEYAPSQNEQSNCVAGINDVGSASMIILDPIDQGIDHVNLYSTGYYNILHSAINVVIPTSAVPSFTIDGKPYPHFTTANGYPTFSYAQIQVSNGPTVVPGGSNTIVSGTHQLKADQPFNAVAYGFGDKEGYGYSAGVNLPNLNEYVNFKNPQNDSLLTGGCAGVKYNMQVTVPYKTTKITWDFKDGSTPYVDNNPVIDSTIITTRIQYVYKYPKLVSYAPGDYTAVATVFNPVADECGSTEDIEFDFTINSPPSAGFTSTATSCGVIAFKDTSTVAFGNHASSWLWDFGDNQTSTLQNPTHTYSKAGNFKTILTVTDNYGCTSVSNPVSIPIADPPVAGFVVLANDCPGQNVTFTDNSTSPLSPIKQWVWSFGDGKTDTLTSSKPFTHTYANLGIDTVKLTVITSGGCKSAVFARMITIHPLPVVDFSLPAVCLADAYAQFTDKSTIADSTQSAFTYVWDFGDGNATATGNVSTLKNPRHKYSREGIYTATLTVTSKYGCIASKVQRFTVNGSIPVAAFVVQNPTTLCSIDSVTFVDQSTVDFGSITKLVWYFDYNNHPNDTVVYYTNTLHANKKYTHSYGAFNNPVQQNYLVKMLAYSGQSCVNPIMQTITVHAKPVINLSPATNVILCQSDMPLQITEDKNGFIGTGVFSGKGISSTGLFDPKMSGAGIFTVYYLFTSVSTGCTYADTIKITVNPAPVITADSQFTLLEGGQLTLNAKAAISTGTMTYKWSPSTGLNRDDIINPVASPSNNTTYVLTVTSDKNCSTSVQVEISVLKLPIIPNAFTPNGDGVNDTWNIENLVSYPNATVEIFNRYGQRVFYSNNYQVQWDGRYNGSEVPVGTYYYIINPKNGRKTMSGPVAVIR